VVVLVREEMGITLILQRLIQFVSSYRMLLTPASEIM
jgi:hypothetical protein